MANDQIHRRKENAPVPISDGLRQGRNPRRAVGHDQQRREGKVVETAAVRRHLRANEELNAFDACVYFNSECLVANSYKTVGDDWLIPAHPGDLPGGIKE